MLPQEEQSVARFRPTHFARLKHIAVFAIVVEEGSFTRAGKRLDIAKSAVSRYVSVLEHNVGVPLLRRTTRKVSLTEAGARFYEDCARLVGAAVNSFDTIGPDVQLMGSLSIAATQGHGLAVVAPAVQSFMQRHRDLTIRLHLSDQFIDLVENGIDLSLRVGSPGPTPQYVSKKIGEMRYRLYAAPQFVGAHGPIDTPQKATRLPWVLGHDTPNARTWTFRKGTTIEKIDVASRLSVNNIVARAKVAALGGGLVGLPDFMDAAELGGELVQVLADFEIDAAVPIFAVYPRSRFPSPRVSEFLAHLATPPA